MKKRLEITPGPWNRVAFGVFGSDNRRLASAQIDDGTGVYKVLDEQEAIANLDLFAEAGTVMHETGLSPRQLANQNVDLVASLKAVTRCLEEHIKEEAKAKDIDPSALCPCLKDEVALAYSLIARADDRRH